MERTINLRQSALRDLLRKLWSQHVYWTRMFIISTAAGLPDTELVTARLLQNPADFAEALTPFYGARNADRFQALLRQHLLIAGDLVNAAKAGNTAAVGEKRREWYRNAEEIAGFLARINPYWEEEAWRQLLFDHLEMTEREAVLRLGGRYAEDIRIFESIEQEALDMADEMAEGIFRQFRM